MKSKVISEVKRGFVEPLHPDAYRDIFLNFTAVSVCVMVGISIKEKWVRRNVNLTEAGNGKKRSAGI